MAASQARTNPPRHNEVGPDSQQIQRLADVPIEADSALAARGAFDQTEATDNGMDLRNNAEITRTAIERLADLPRLQTVNVFGTGGADELDELQQVLPQAKSTYSP